MTMDNISQYFKGKVKIKISGQSPERFINLCLVHKIPLASIVRVGERTLVISLAAQDVKKLRPVLHKSACHMHVINKSGLPFLKKKALRRKSFMAGALIFCFCLYIFSTFIWSVEVKAEKPLQIIAKGQVLERASFYGLHPGVSILFVNINDMRENLIKDFPYAAWIGLDIVGTKAIITIYERSIVPQEESNKPADLVAEKDALIEEIFVISGTAIATKGMTVRQGDVLIGARVYPPVTEGQEPPPSEEKYTRAKGIIRARTWYEADAKVFFKENNYYRTGRNNYSVLIKTPDGTKKDFSLKKFTAYEKEKVADWKNNKFSVELQLLKYREVKNNIIQMNLEQAKKAALVRVEKELRKIFPPTAKLVNRHYIWYNIKNGVSVRMIWEARENIGVNR